MLFHALAVVASSQECLTSNHPGTALSHSWVRCSLVRGLVKCSVVMSCVMLYIIVNFSSIFSFAVILNMVLNSVVQGRVCQVFQVWEGVLHW